MHDPGLTELERRRLDAKLTRLQSYLESDPANAMLALETFEAAFALGRLDIAESSLAGVSTQSPHAGPVRFRLANLRIAQQRLPEAAELLDALQHQFGIQPGFTQTRALLHFVGSNFEQCVATLAPCVDKRAPLWAESIAQHAAIDNTSRAELQMLWLRSLHRLGELDRAWAWIQDARTTDQLTPAAAGVACLIALDGGPLSAIEELAERSGMHPASRPEVLLALGSLQLHHKNGAQAREHLNALLALDKANGRAWSTLAFVHMMESKPELAIDSFDRAIDVMPNHAGTWIGLGWARLLAKWPIADTKAAFQTAVDVDHNFAEGHGCVAVALAIEGKRQDALQSIIKAKRLDKRCWSSQFAQMILDGKAGDAALVERLAQQLLASASASERRPARKRANAR